MIELMTRVRSPILYDRMISSAFDKAGSRFLHSYESDTEGLPKCAETYNRLALASNADIYGFVEDDIEFLSENWDWAVEDIFLEYRPDILGVVGAAEYHGGGYFEAGYEHAYGLVACNKSKDDQTTFVRILSPYYRHKRVKVIDGALMFCRSEFFRNHLFDSKVFDELFFYDIDLCLKSKHVAITCDIVAKHSKPPEFYGVYPKNMKKASDYESILLERHGIEKKDPKSQMCCLVSYETFKQYGQTGCVRNFERKYECASA